MHGVSFAFLETKQEPLKATFNIILREGVSCLLTFGLLFSCYIFLQYLPASSVCKPFFQSFNFWLISKMAVISSDFSNRELALNFLTNIRIDNFQIRQEFCSSGLAHLLAISGGQISLFVLPILFGARWLLFLLFHKALEPIKFMQIIFLISSGVNFVVVTILALIFGFTGALVRVCYSACLGNNYMARRALVGFKRDYGICISPFTILRVLFLIIIGLIYKNPFRDIGFLLSSVGAEFSIISYYLIMKLSGRKKAGKLLSYFLHSIISSISITLVLFPIFVNNPFVSAAANLIALPLVNLLVTPLTIFVILIPNYLTIRVIFINWLDYLLGVLNFMAKIFANDQTGSVCAFGAISFSGSLTYLSVLLLFVWGVSDVVAEYKLRSIFRMN